MTDTPTGATRRQIDATGVPGLDLVLGGGLPRGALVIVVGPPGSGKTTLANQIAFTSARAGQRVMMLAALSESTSKLIAHLRTFHFYHEDLVGDQIQFLSIEQFLSEEYEAISEKVLTMAHQARANLVVLDGFRGVRGKSIDPQQARQFLYDVGTALSTLGTTTIVTSEVDPRDPTFFPEAMIADAIFGLYYNLAGVRQQRAFEVIKLRGATPLSGLHGMALDNRGITVYPRLEAQVTEMRREPASSWERIDSATDALKGLSERASFGLTELDALLGGGLTRGTSTLLVGHLGTGKTLLGLHFALAGVHAGERAVFLGFRESQGQLIVKADAFDLGSALRAALAPEGGVTLLRLPPVELNLEIVANQLLTALDRSGARRLVVDSIAELERAIMQSWDPQRLDDFLAALIEMLRTRGVTTLIIKEISQLTPHQQGFSEDALSVIAENVVLLRQVAYQSRLHRVLSVLKTRFAAYDPTLREFIIAPPHGIRVLGPFESHEGVLAGIAAQHGGLAPDSTPPEPQAGQGTDSAQERRV